MHPAAKLSPEWPVRARTSAPTTDPAAPFHARALAATAAFAEAEGRRPRVLVADEEGRLATAFADLGFDVDVAPPASTAQQLARQSADNDVHLVAGYGHAAALRAALIDENAPDVLVMAVAVGPDPLVDTHTGATPIGGGLDPADVPALLARLRRTDTDG